MLKCQLFHRPRGRFQDVFPTILFFHQSFFFFMNELKMRITAGWSSLPVLLLFAQDINHGAFSFHHMGARRKDGWGLQRWWGKKKPNKACRVSAVSCDGVNATSPGTGLESLPSDLPRGAAEIRARLDFSHAAAPRWLHNGGGWGGCAIFHFQLAACQRRSVTSRRAMASGMIWGGSRSDGWTRAHLEFSY